jgi:hypothetical protein
MKTPLMIPPYSTCRHCYPTLLYPASSNSGALSKTPLMLIANRIPVPDEPIGKQKEFGCLLRSQNMQKNSGAWGESNMHISHTRTSPSPWPQIPRITADLANEGRNIADAWVTLLSNHWVLLPESLYLCDCWILLPGNACISVALTPIQCLPHISAWQRLCGWLYLLAVSDFRFRRPKDRRLGYAWFAGEWFLDTRQP